MSTTDKKQVKEVQLVSDLAKKITKSDIKGTKSFVITTAVCDAPVHKGFYTMKRFAEIKKAKLIVLPIMYNWKRNNELKTFDRNLRDYLYYGDISLNKNLMICGSVNIRPTAVNPLSGMHQIGVDKSVIFPHTQLAMTPIANAKNKFPRLHYTTGACTQPRYTKEKNGSETKAGKKGHINHNISCLYVQIVGERFWIRDIEVDEKGNMYDLGEMYNKDGFVKKEPVPALILGDVHVKWLKKPEYNAIIEQVKYLKPKNLVLHDLHDNYSTSHHHKCPVFNTAKSHIRDDILQDELKLSVDFIEKMKELNTSPIVVKSNHDDHMDQWYSRLYDKGYADEHIDNIELHSQLTVDVIKYIKENGQKPNIFDMYMTSKIEGYRCTNRDEQYLVNGIELGQHGDVGSDGSRGWRGLQKSGQKIVSGHTHKCVIDKNYRSVGVMALEMGYAKGYSSWTSSCVIVHPNSKLQTIHVVGGKNKF